MSTEQPTKLTIVLTHPVQYFSPWFRYIHAHERRLALTVLYAARPTPDQQGIGFDRAFEWDIPLLDGYQALVVGAARPGRSFGSDSATIDVGDIGDRIAATRPDAVLIPGWHCPLYRRALRECRRRGIAVLYRGDSNLLTVHRGLSKSMWELQTMRRLAAYDAYLSVGVRAGDFLRHFGASSDRLFASPHAVDNGYFAAAAAPHQSVEGRRTVRRQFGIAEDQEFVALFVGKLEDKKRPLDAVRAAAAASATLLVAGSGPLEAALRAEASRLGARVQMAGFLNQSRIAEAYAAADCLVLPSDRRETWGLVVNEAMATGLPCVVSDESGCAPDLVDDTTGAIVPVGDVAALSEALVAIRSRLQSGHRYAEACRARISRYAFAQATEGLAAACRVVGVPAQPAPSPRIVAWCGHLVIAGGMERSVFEVLRQAIAGGGTVHCLVNTWDSTRITALAEEIGASWSSVYNKHPLSRRVVNPVKVAGMIADVLITSAELLHQVARRRATHVVLPDFTSLVRCAPALAVLRCRGRVSIVIRVANAPEPAFFYQALWRLVVNPLTTRFVANSKFTRGELLRAGVPQRKVEWVYNTIPRRSQAAVTELASPSCDVVFVGQIIPEKGLHVLLDAIALIRRDRPDVTLNVVGDLEGWVPPRYAGYRDSLLARAALPDLAGSVRFLGWRTDVSAVLSHATVHCCPSLAAQREAFGNVVLEAKAAARPSVVSPWGGLPELIEHGRDGWICPDVTPETLAEGLRFFLDDSSRWGLASRAALASLGMFSDGRFARVWGEVLAFAPAAGTPAVCGSNKGSVENGHTLPRR